MSARILRTRSGRELRNLEPVSRRTKQVINGITKTNKIDKLPEHEENVKSDADNSKQVFTSIKRKRGRPKNSTTAHREEHADVNAEDLVKKKCKVINESKNGEDNFESSRRKPRMASLNAMAKVNAVLENYRTQSKKDILAVIEEIDKKCSEQAQKKLREEDKQVVDEDQVEECVFEEVEEINSKKDIIMTEYKLESKDGKSKEKVASLDLIEAVITKEKGIQTDVFHKSIQTDIMYSPGKNSPTLCTCHMKVNNTILPYYAPTLNYKEFLRDPIHIKSSVLAHAESHSVAVPILKRHILWENSNKLLSKAEFSPNVNCLVENCITNTLMKNSFPCSKLMYVASYKQKRSTDKKPNDFKPESQCKTSKKQTGLLVPSLNYAPISVPNSTYHSNSKASRGEDSLLATTAKRQKAKFTGKSKKCNGWQFDGEILEKVTSTGNVGNRKYYQSVVRNGISIKIHDAVILKSGLGKTDADFVARISSFWEDTEEQLVGEMMMSVLWYYKPEQMNGRMNDVGGEEMEVFASRHKDDNSVACIVGKCYVVSFPQYCRFRAQQLIARDSRKRKQLVCFESKNNRSRFIPSPDVDPPIVYFCRHGYDFRTGRVLKNY